MAMADKDNDIVLQFLKEQKQDIPDNGFSSRVMRNLPDRKTHRLVVLGRMWSCVCIFAALLFICSDYGHTLIVSALDNIMCQFKITELKVNTTHLIYAMGAAYLAMLGGLFNWLYTKILRA